MQIFPGSPVELGWLWLWLRPGDTGELKGKPKLEQGQAPNCAALCARFQAGKDSRQGAGIGEKESPDALSGQRGPEHGLVRVSMVQL